MTMLSKFMDVLSEVGSYISFGSLAVAMIGMLLVNRKIKSKILAANKVSRGLIVEAVGEKKFDKLLNAQKEYMDAYYEALYPSDEEEKLEETTEEVIEETK